MNPAQTLTPDVSVIIPAYNAARTLATTIASVQAQELCCWELIVVDDGSNDGTRSLVESLAALDPRIRLAGGARRGVSAARNLGVSLARAPLVAFLDADDIWSREKLAAQVAHLEQRPGLGVSFTRARFLTPDGEPTGTISAGSVCDLQAADLLYGNPTTTASTLCVRRCVFDVAGGFDEAMSFAEDLEWLVRVRCLSRWRIAGIGEALTGYRTSCGGLSSDLERMRLGWETMLRRVASYAPGVVARHHRPARASQLRYLARRALRLGLGARLALRYLRESLAVDWRILGRDPYSVAGTAALALARIAREALRPRAADPGGLQP